MAIGNLPSPLQTYGPLPEEIEIIEPRAVEPIVDWAPKHLVIPAKESPKLAGLFDWQYSPHLREPCNWFNDPYVRRITLMAGLQRGKSLFMMLCLCWLIANDPGPTMLVMTDENTLRRRMKRIRPLFAANDYLLRKLGGKVENLFLGELTDLGDMVLTLAWAGSAAMLSDYPIRYEFLDELVLWQQTLISLSLDPMALLRGRQNTHAEDSKTVTVSSSGNVGDLLDTEFEEGDRCEYWVRCPICDFPQIPIWRDPEDKDSRMMLDKDKAGDWLSIREYESGRHARYVCPSCMKPWTDYDRMAAMDYGRWLPAGVTMDPHGNIVGEILPTPYKSARVRAVMVHPRLGSLGKMGADWVRAQAKLKAGDVSGLKYFLNNHEAFSWRDEKSDTDVDRLKTHRGAYRSGQAPWGVQAIVIAIDVHDDWFRVVILGFGFLFEAWQIEVIRIETSDTKEIQGYDPLKPLLVRPWQLADGQWLVPSAVVIDSGYQTEPVKTFCRANRHAVHNANLIPIRGSPRRLSRMYQKFPDDESLIVYELNPLMFKDQLYRMLFASQEPGPGYMHLPEDATAEVIGELCSEHKVVGKDGYPVWQPKKDRRDNHTWDASYYALFAAHLIGVGLLGPLPETPPPPRTAAKPKRDREQGGGFLDGLPSLK